MDAEELAGFIVHNRLAWRIWMKGYESGLVQGHQDERTGMENLADLVARRQLVLAQCRDHVVAERVNTFTMAEVRQARNHTRVGGYTGGAVPWEQDGHE